jgi:GTP-binding protein Era
MNRSWFTVFASVNVRLHAQLVAAGLARSETAAPPPLRLGICAKLGCRQLLPILEGMSDIGSEATASNTAAPDSQFRAGLAVLVGRTNVGKSTLLNALVGRKICIVTPKPQTTRDPIQGVVHRPEGQIVFVDTPGFFKTHASRLVDRLHERARQALKGIDVVVHVVDPSRAIGPEDEMVLEALQAVTQPRVLCLNKADLPDRPYAGAWKARQAEYAAVHEVSAYTGQGLEALTQGILALLPVGPPLYPENQITNAHRNFLLAELIREKVYLLMDDEVPYRTAVEVGSVQERLDKQGQPLVHVKATLLAANPRYQRMLIGAGGRRIAQIGKAARQEMEALLGRKVFLDMDVMVDRRLAG